MNNPLVTIITPTTYDRAAFNERCLAIVAAQTYRNIEHIMMYEQFPTLGQKMNECIKLAKGSIIVNMDSDDYYAPDWVGRCVALMLRTKVDVAGLKCGYFKRGEELLTYTYPDNTPHFLGATMCHTKEFWERNPYRHMQVGYDVMFTQTKCNTATIPYTDGFVATIHDANTSPKNTTGERWAKVENIPTSVHTLLARFRIAT